jgi:hypothetical protein
MTLPLAFEPIQDILVKPKMHGRFPREERRHPLSMRPKAVVELDFLRIRTGGNEITPSPHLPELFEGITPDVYFGAFVHFAKQ